MWRAQESVFLESTSVDSDQPHLITDLITSPNSIREQEQRCGMNTDESQFRPLWSLKEVTKEVTVLISYLWKRDPEMSNTSSRGWNVNQCFQSQDKVLLISFNSLILASSAWAGAGTAQGTAFYHFLIMRHWPCLAKPHVSSMSKE